MHNTCFVHLIYVTIFPCPLQGFCHTMTILFNYMKAVAVLFNYITNHEGSNNYIFRLSSCFRLIIAMGYFGLTLNTGRLGGDVYLNFLATIIVEVLGYGICLLLMDRIGRRPVLCGSMLLGGVACICTIFTTLYADKCKFTNVKSFSRCHNFWPLLRLT